MHHHFLRAKSLSFATTAGLGIVMMAATTSHAAVPQRSSASVANGTLTVTGTNGGDSIAINSPADAPGTVLVDFGDGTQPQSFDLSTFSAISVFLGAGDDTFTMAPSGTALAGVPVTVEGGSGDDRISSGPAADVLSGGAGDDVINGGDGNDVIFGDGGSDTIDGQRGNDTEALGGGDDTATWAPGEGSDVVDGNGGTDAMVFGGANVNEITSLSADGTHALFLRDVANIRMDLNNIEAFSFNALGGADTMTVNDLSGTDVRQVNLDLSNPAGSGTGDGLADTVTVNGTNKADNVAVDAYGSGVDVSGLHADVQITGAEAANDHLQINTVGGNDTVGVSDAANALLPTSVDLGTGQR